MSKITSGPGPVGTIFLSYFIDSNLGKLESYVKVKDHKMLIENSIKFGISWLYANVFRKNLSIEDLSIADEFRRKLLLYPLRDVGYNNLIMECCYLWISYIKHKNINLNKESQVVFYDEESTKWHPVYKLKDDLINIETNIVLHDYLIVEVSDGIFQKFVYVRHDTHYDYLPLWYVLNKFPKIKYYLHIK